MRIEPTRHFRFRRSRLSGRALAGQKTNSNMATLKISSSRPPDRAFVEDLYDHINKTCLVMVDRSMWFAKSYEALADNNFACLVRKHPQLAGKDDSFCVPVVYACSYAQRVFLCSAMELCLMHQHTNSVTLLFQLQPSRTTELCHLLELLKKKHKIKNWEQWTALDWDLRLQQLRELSFSSVGAAAKLFDDIYGTACFDVAWGKEPHQQLAGQYKDYQVLRNGILHRGGEFSSGDNIGATEADIARTFDDGKRFRDAILRLSDWCRRWWIGQLASGSGRSTQH